MARKYLKKATMTSATGASDVRDTVQNILDDIEARGDEGALSYAAKFDQYEGNIKLTKEEIDAAAALVPEKLKRDIEFAHNNVRRFAEAQMTTLQNVEIEVVPGLTCGQKSIPVTTAGCYIPGGRYSHIASAIMTVTTASVAGCKNIIACSPPRPGVGIAPAIIYAAHICGADTILALGGVQGVAAMAFGLFGLPKADILVGPGNQFVAEAKRILYGRVGIDMFAGPTDSLILADKTISSFEFFLYALLRKHLTNQSKDVKKGKITSYRHVVDEVSYLLSIIALAGNGYDPVTIGDLMNSFIKDWQAPPRTPEFDAKRLDQCLKQLNRLTPLLKKPLMLTLAEVVMSDGKIKTAELELMRATAIYLECPLPTLSE